MKRHFSVDFGIDAAKMRRKRSFHAGRVEIVAKIGIMEENIVVRKEIV